MAISLLSFTRLLYTDGVVMVAGDTFCTVDNIVKFLKGLHGRLYSSQFSGVTPLYLLKKIRGWSEDFRYLRLCPRGGMHPKKPPGS